MKKLISVIGTYTCYYIGSFFGYLMNISFLDFLYEPYKKMMTLSFEIQDWGGLKSPWKKTEHDGLTFTEEEKEL